MLDSRGPWTLNRFDETLNPVVETQVAKLGQRSSPWSTLPSHNTLLLGLCSLFHCLFMHWHTPFFLLITLPHCILTFNSLLNLPQGPNHLFLEKLHNPMKKPRSPLKPAHKPVQQVRFDSDIPSLKERATGSQANCSKANASCPPNDSNDKLDHPESSDDSSDDSYKYNISDDSNSSDSSDSSDDSDASDDHSDHVINPTSQQSKLKKPAKESFSNEKTANTSGPKTTGQPGVKTFSLPFDKSGFEDYVDHGASLDPEGYPLFPNGNTISVRAPGKTYTNWGTLGYVYKVESSKKVHKKEWKSTHLKCLGVMRCGNKDCKVLGPPPTGKGKIAALKTK